jgi:hypothetical protein
MQAAMSLVAMNFLADDTDSFSVVFACMMLLIFVGGGLYAVIWLRRRFWGGEEEDVPHTGFTLGDLRHLHKSGQMSTEEFEKAKGKIIEAAKRAAERDAASVKPTPQRPGQSGQ